MSDEIQALEAKLFMQVARRLPVTLVRGEGTRVWDSEGKEYLDFVAGISTNTFGHADPGLVQTITEWTRDSSRVLLALDAPLGWPAPLSKALASHEAGAALAVQPNDLFRRLTDRVVRDKIGKQSLDVGADRIARTAHAALALLGELRSTIGHPIPLAWRPKLGRRLAAIEVYPAATLKVHGLPTSGYKATGDVAQRRQILRGIKRRVQISRRMPLLLEDANALDAAVCVVAAMDFLSGSAIRPDDLNRAKREGWIWVREPE